MDEFIHVEERIPSTVSGSGLVSNHFKVELPLEGRVA